MPFLDANGITQHYMIDGPPTSPHLLVLINGLADDLTTWDAQIPALTAAGYRTLRYDNRGIGRTSRPPGPYSAALLANDLHALLSHPDLAALPPAFHLLGVSMGGMIAQAYALAHPNNNNNSSSGRGGRTLLSLSLCCTYAAPGPFCARMFEYWADVARRMSVADVMRDVLLWAFTVPFFKHEDRVEEIEAALREIDMGTEEYLAQLEVIRRFDVTSELDGLKAEERVLGALGAPGEEGAARRVMVLAGRTDILIPVSLSRELAERIEGCQFVVVKGGHACLLEFPDDFNQAIIRFLDEFKVQ